MIEKTKEKIKLSLLQLMKEKHFMSISVRDITIRAAINRGRFYLHYQDKYDLIDQMEQDLLSSLLENYKVVPTTNS